MRGATLDGVVLALAVSLGAVLFAGNGGRLRFDDTPAWSVLLAAVTANAVAVAVIRPNRRDRFDASHPASAVRAFSATVAVRSGLGLMLMVDGTVVAVLTGWWQPAAIGGLAMLAFVGAAAPTSKRIARTETVWRARGYGGDLLGELLRAGPSR
jgi:hypothetical protein